jgi:hypothetical protein
MREHFGLLAHFLKFDSPGSRGLTQQQLGWQPMRPGLIHDVVAVSPKKGGNDDLSEGKAAGR